MREAVLPGEFYDLHGKVQYVRRKTANEWSSSCPKCGGTQHQNGSFPDRFLMWPVSKTGKPMGWCRVCGYVWMPHGEKPPSKEDFELWRKQRIEQEERIKKEAEVAIANLNSKKIWEYYHTRLNEWARQIITEWGLNDEYAKYWQIGMIEDFIVKSGEDSYHSPAMSIPNWQPGWQVSNVKVRVLNPRDSGDRYRSLYKTGVVKPFWAFPDMDAKHAVVVEGEKKAMVVASRSDQTFQVIGIPTKTPGEDTLSALDKFERITLCLDPDAKVIEKNAKVSALGRMVAMLGRDRTGVLNLPGKVDDLIVWHNLDFSDAMRYTKFTKIGGNK